MKSFLSRSLWLSALLFATVTLHPGRADFIAIDPQGEEFDRFSIPSAHLSPPSLSINPLKIKVFA